LEGRIAAGGGAGLGKRRKRGGEGAGKEEEGGRSGGEGKGGLQVTAEPGPLRALLCHWSDTFASV